MTTHTHTGRHVRSRRCGLPVGWKAFPFGPTHACNKTAVGGVFATLCGESILFGSGTEPNVLALHRWSPEISCIGCLAAFHQAREPSDVSS